MHTKCTQQTIVSLPLHNLHPHPDNANRMSKAKFNMLVGHIKTTQQYEPLVVRKHPIKKGSWQLLNGHHRLRVLRKLKYTHADCVIFNANDEQAQLYLLNLNHLTGRDNIYRKARLIDQLCQHTDPRELAKRIADSKTAIEELSRLSRNQPLSTSTKAKPFLLPMTFFMTESQHARVTAAFEKVGMENAAGQNQKRLDALCRIVEDFLSK